MNKRMQFRYFKNEDALVKDLKFIRLYFGENANNILSRDFAFPNGVTGAELLEKWNRSQQSLKRANHRYKMLMMKPLREQLPATLYYGAQYETLFSLMEIFRTNKITEKEIDFVLAHSKHYFETYFDERLKESEIQEEM